MFIFSPRFEQKRVSSEIVGKNLFSAEEETDLKCEIEKFLSLPLFSQTFYIHIYRCVHSRTVYTACIRHAKNSRQRASGTQLEDAEITGSREEFSLSGRAVPRGKRRGGSSSPDKASRFEAFARPTKFQQETTTAKISNRSNDWNITRTVIRTRNCCVSRVKRRDRVLRERYPVRRHSEDLENVIIGNPVLSLSLSLACQVEIHTRSRRASTGSLLRLLIDSSRLEKGRRETKTERMGKTTAEKAETRSDRTGYG